MLRQACECAASGASILGLWVRTLAGDIFDHLGPLGHHHDGLNDHASAAVVLGPLVAVAARTMAHASIRGPRTSTPGVGQPMGSPARRQLQRRHPQIERVHLGRLLQAAAAAPPELCGVQQAREALPFLDHDAWCSHSPGALADGSDVILRCHRASPQEQMPATETPRRPRSRPVRSWATYDAVAVAVTCPPGE
jgi:hypothetical protein